MPPAWSSVFVLIPAFNHTAELHRLKESWQFGEELPVVVVDDGSQPPIPAENFQPWRILRHEHNRGKGAALKTGLRYGLSRGFRFAITLDADGQHSTQLIPAFWAEGQTGALVLGRRRLDPRAMPWPRILSNTLTSLILSLRTGQRIYDSQVGFRCYPLQPQWYWQSPENGFQYESAVLLRAARSRIPLRWVNIPTQYVPGGKSHIRHVADTLRFIQLVLKSLLWRNI